MILRQKTATELLDRYVENNDIEEFDKVTDIMQYEIIAYILEAFYVGNDSHASEPWTENKDFDKMQTGLLRCLKSPTDAAKIDFATTILESISSYLAPTARDIVSESRQIIDTDNERAEKEHLQDLSYGGTNE